MVWLYVIQLTILYIVLNQKLLDSFFVKLRYEETYLLLHNR